MNTKNILLVLIGIVSLMIVVSLAVAVSVVRSQLQLESIAVIETVEEVDKGQESVDPETRPLTSEQRMEILTNMEAGNVEMTEIEKEQMLAELTSESQGENIDREQRLDILETLEVQ
jgi:biopolymer transport protein ExbB/TolQ